MNVYPLGIHQKEQISIALSYFLKVKNTYKTNLPESILLPEVPDYDIYLCRVNIFAGIGLRISSLISKGIIIDDGNFSDFCSFINRRAQFNQDNTSVRTTAEEIELIANTVNQVISVLESLPKH